MNNDIKAHIQEIEQLGIKVSVLLDRISKDIEDIQNVLIDYCGMIEIDMVCGAGMLSWNPSRYEKTKVAKLDFNFDGETKPLICWPIAKRVQAHTYLPVFLAEVKQELHKLINNL